MRVFADREPACARASDARREPLFERVAIGRGVARRRPSRRGARETSGRSRPSARRRAGRRARRAGAAARSRARRAPRGPPRPRRGRSCSRAPGRRRRPRARARRSTPRDERLARPERERERVLAVHAAARPRRGPRSAEPDGAALETAPTSAAISSRSRAPSAHAELARETRDAPRGEGARAARSRPTRAACARACRARAPRARRSCERRALRRAILRQAEDPFQVVAVAAALELAQRGVAERVRIVQSPRADRSPSCAQRSLGARPPRSARARARSAPALSAARSAGVASSRAANGCGACAGQDRCPTRRRRVQPAADASRRRPRPRRSCTGALERRGERGQLRRQRRAEPGDRGRPQALLGPALEVDRAAQQQPLARARHRHVQDPFLLLGLGRLALLAERLVVERRRRLARRRGARAAGRRGRRRRAGRARSCSAPARDRRRTRPETRGPWRRGCSSGGPRRARRRRPARRTRAVLSRVLQVRRVVEEAAQVASLARLEAAREARAACGRWPAAARPIRARARARGSRSSSIARSISSRDRAHAAPPARSRVEAARRSASERVAVAPPQGGRRKPRSCAVQRPSPTAGPRPARGRRGRAARARRSSSRRAARRASRTAPSSSSGLASARR